MALLPSTLVSALDNLNASALEAASTDAPMSSHDYNVTLAAAIATFIKTADVTVDSGITVTTTGTATAQKGSTTVTGSGTLN